MMLAANVWNRVATAATVAPTLQGTVAVAQALGVLGLTSGFMAGTGLTSKFVRLDHFVQQPPSASVVATTFARVMVVPSLFEELIWRVVFQPPGMAWTRLVAINGAFALYHVLGSAALAEHLDGRVGARAVFCDPAFLFLAFVLGNVCSFGYIRAGYALWAPVLVHAVPVTLWLSFFGGETALSTRGGLSPIQEENQTTLLPGDRKNDSSNAS